MSLKSENTIIRLSLLHSDLFAVNGEIFSDGQCVQEKHVFSFLFNGTYQFLNLLIKLSLKTILSSEEFTPCLPPSSRWLLRDGPS